MAQSPAGWIGSCAHCGAVAATADAVAELVGRPLSLERWPSPEPSTVPCPLCEGVLLDSHVVPSTHDAFEGPPACFFRCGLCGSVVFDRGILPDVRRALEQLPAPTATHPGPDRPPLGSPIEGTVGALSPVRSEVAPTVDPAPSAPPPDPWTFRNPAIDAWVFAGALPGAFLFRSMSLGLVLTWPTSMALHELGHATVAWLGGRVAIPLFFIGVTFMMGTGRSLLPTALFLGLFAWAFRLGGAASSATRFFGAVALVHGALMLLAPKTIEELILLGGFSGEIAFATLALCGFAYEGPRRLRWDFFRYPALVAGAMALLGASSMWSAADRDISALPTGSILSTRSDRDGDINRLVALHGWEGPTLAHTFYGATKVAFALVLVHGIVLVRRARQQAPDRRPWESP